MNEKDLIVEGEYSSSIVGFAEHYHNYHEIIFVKNGSAAIKYSNKEYRLKKNSLVFISNLEKHQVYIDSDSYERYWLYISPKILRQSIKSNTLCSLFSLRPQNFCHVVDVTEISDRVETVIKEMLSSLTLVSHYRYDYQKSLMRVLLIDLYRLDKNIFPAVNAVNSNFVYRIQKELELNFNKNYSLEKLANDNSISKSYLSHAFKNITGYGIMEYLTELRISAAKDLLINTEYSSFEISNECGFSSSSNFARYMKKTTGMTPLQYRKKHKESLNSGKYN